MTKRNLIWAVTLLAIAVILVLAKRPTYSPSRQEGLAPQFRALDETYRLIQDKGYSPSADRDLVRGAVGGMAGAADEYSSYIPPDKAESFQRRMEGKDRGVGLKLEQVGGQLRVHQALFGSPAARAALATGDVILTIDDRAAEGLTAAEAERLVNEGPLGTAVRLQVAGPNDEVHAVTLERREFPVESVAGVLRRQDGQWVYLVRAEPAVAYVRIREFVRSTAEEIRIALRQVDAPQGLVLDLRDNPGGQFPVAVEVADLFLREGTIVTLVDKSGPQPPYTARPEGSYPEDLRLVVLVNGKTASAAEIVAGALALNRRAVLVGTRTRGKGAIQGMFRLPDGMGEMNLTTAEFLLGEGRSIGRREGSSTWGIDPQVEVVIPAVDGRRLSRLRLDLEAGVSTQLAPTTRRARGRSATQAGASTAPATGAATRALLALDAQLRKAVDLLADPEAFDGILHQAAATAPESSAAP
ncbi:MAG: S41 family peptidase [Phycisphaerae bacterium]|nr:S41 family peptidase [Phycisphaerae bacterium]